MSVKHDTIRQLQIRVVELEQKIKDLEEQSEKLDEKFNDIEGGFNVLLVKAGSKIGKRVDDRVDTNIDAIEYRILKKLVDGNMFELRMKNKSKEEK